MLDPKHYRTEGICAFINERLEPLDFIKYVMDYPFGSVAPKGVVLHHTWSPTRASWRGLASMRGMQSYYQNTLLWASGPHIYTADDGIWLGHPMHLAAIHANDANCNADAYYQAKGSDNRTRTYINNNKVWRYTIGVEMVGNYDPARPENPTWGHTKAVLGALCYRFGKSPREFISFHRDYSTKSCPGRAVTHEWVWAEVEGWLNEYKYLFGTPQLEVPSVPVPANSFAPGYFEVITSASLRQSPDRELRPVRTLRAPERIGIKGVVKGEFVDGSDEWYWLSSEEGFIHGKALRMV